MTDKIKPGDLIKINLIGQNTDVYYFWPYPYDHTKQETHPRIYYYSLNDPPLLYLGPVIKMTTLPNSEGLYPHKFLHEGKVIFTQIREGQTLEEVFEKVG